MRNIGWFLLSVLCYFVLSQGGFFKYIFIMIIAFCGIGMRNFYVSKKYWVILSAPVCYFVTGLILAVVNFNITKFTFKDSCFILIPAIAAICVFSAVPQKDVRIALDMQFGAIGIISIIIGSASLRHGSLFESQYAYILGAYAIYYYAYKRKGLFCAAVILTYLANKRIVHVAVIASILLYTVIRLLKNKQAKKWIINCAIIGTVCVCYGWIAAIKKGMVYAILSTFHIQSNGRTNIWGKIAPFYEWGLLYLGKGIGFVTNYLNELQIPGFANLHNDLLRTYIEVGFWGFGLCVVSYFCIIYKVKNTSSIYDARKVLLICLVVYTFMNFLTDNILIYINYWFPVYMLFLGIIFAPLDCRRKDKC